MNSFIRGLMFIYSVVIAVISVVLLYALVDDGIFADILFLLLNYMWCHIWCQYTVNKCSIDMLSHILQDRF